MKNFHSLRKKGEGVLNRKGFKKLLSSLLIFILIFTLFQPAFSHAQTNTNIQSSKQVNSDERISQLKNIINQQKELLKKDPYLDSSLKMAKSDGEVKVIVQLSEEPVALAKGKQTVKGKSFSQKQASTVKNKVLNQQARFEKQLKAEKINYKKGFTYHQAFNGMSLTVNKSELQKLLKINGVVSIHPDEEVHALEVKKDDTVKAAMMDSNPHLKIPEIWKLGYEGQGVKVAVLDTGIDYNHPELKDVYKGGHNFIIHGSNYARDRAEDDPYETTPEDRPDNMPEFDEDGDAFYTSHGTHVAGIIAAQGNNKYNIKGVAPKVDLYAYRVLGAYGSGSTSGIIAGIDKAVEENMDIINLSLGGSSNSQTAPDAIAINNATLAGVTAVVATGNSGPGRSTIGNPASAALAISVGNSTLPEETFQATLTVEAGDFRDEYKASLMGWTFGKDPSETLTGEYDVVAVPGFGTESDYEGLDVKGKIALVSRGEIPFVDKIAAAKNHGAAGLLVHNNVGEAPSGILLGNSFAFIPTFDISTKDGNAFRKAIEATANKTGKVTVSGYEKGTTEGDKINDSSSRGPSTPTFDIKPDVSAPGTNIMSSVPAYGKDYPDADYSEAYDRFTGTSMATPQVAGIAALLLSKNPDWTPFDVKVAISNTAKQLDTKLYDVFAQGPGRAQPLEAMNAEALAYALDTTSFEEKTIEYEKGTVTFGKVAPDPESEKKITKQIEVRDLVDKSSNFDVSVEVTKAATGEMADARVTVDKSSFTLNGKETLNVTLTVPAGEESPDNEMLGYIHLTNGTTKLILPFAAAFSTAGPAGLSYYQLLDNAISPNRDGKYEETALQFGLLGDEELMSLELWDAQNPSGGPFGDGYLGYFAFQPLPAGDWKLKIDGTYFDWETGEKTEIPEGVYTVDYNSWDLANETITFLADDGPLFVKTSTPEIEFNKTEEIKGSEYELTGSINDKFIDFKSAVEEAFGIPYDVNEKLTVTYRVTDKDGNDVGSGPVTLKQDGSFAISLTKLPAGENTVTLHVEDIVANASDKEVKLNVEGEQKDVHITLTPSTTEPTEGPVTVKVDTDSTSPLVSMKWLQGEKTVEDFANAGNDIDLEKSEFNVTENGTYTVYVKNSENVEAVQTITVENIKKPAENFAITLTPSTTEPTEGPVTISVNTDSKADLVALKWLQGEKTAEDFANAGYAIDLDKKTFDVSENGIYTVYAKNSENAEVVQTLKIENITKPADEFTVTLTPSTVEPTEGPVTVKIETNSEADLVSMKWLEGKKATEDFANAGNEINLEESSFSVTTNGVYTVYVKNSKGVEVVQTIEINNIVIPAVSIALTPSTTEETEEPVSIKVDADSTSALVELKWLEGKQNVDAFHNAGNPIDLEAKQFDVTENGTYTVYAKNSGGAEAVQTITIDNIKVVEKEEIVITTPSIANGVATISDDDIDRVKNGGTFIIELGKADKVRVFLTADQIKTLKEKQVSLIIRNYAVEIQIPSNNLADGEDISIDVRKVDDVASADQAVSGVYDFTIYAGDKVVSDFGEPIILVFTVDNDKVKSTDKLNVYYYNEEMKKWELIPNAVHKDGKVSVGINHFSTFAVFAKDPNKQDPVPLPTPGGQDPVPQPNPSGKEDPKGPSPKDAGDKNQSIYDGSNQNSGKNGGELPNTATPYNNYFIIGFVLVMIGVAAVYFQYRKKRKTMM